MIDNSHKLCFNDNCKKLNKVNSVALMVGAIQKLD